MHRSVAVLMFLCIVTAAILYNGSLAIHVGHRHAVELIHVYCGFALPVPMLVGLLSPGLPQRSRSAEPVRADRTGAGYGPAPDETAAIRVGKFNAGQKLNASLTAGAIVVLLGTGILMYFVGLVATVVADRRDVRARLVRARARTA